MGPDRFDCVAGICQRKARAWGELEGGDPCSTPCPHLPTRRPLPGAPHLREEVKPQNCFIEFSLQVEGVGYILRTAVPRPVRAGPGLAWVAPSSQGPGGEGNRARFLP